MPGVEFDLKRGAAILNRLVLGALPFDEPLENDGKTVGCEKPLLDIGDDEIVELLHRHMPSLAN
ncbi:hypothetical protein [Rhodoblastus sp.]|uniref:hypothetical protein n=1 Tax=Rhodoblastus sp. TaxID=1962975 RepID=UPI003F9BFEE8